MKYQTKPVQVEAMQYCGGDSVEKISKWLKGRGLNWRVFTERGETIKIWGESGPIRLYHTDWIVLDENNGSWHYTDDHFKLIYKDAK